MRQCTVFHLSIACMECTSRPCEEQQPVGPTMVQVVQNNLLILLCTDETVPLISFNAEHADDLLSEEVHPLVGQRHPSFERALLRVPQT